MLTVIRIIIMVALSSFNSDAYPQGAGRKRYSREYHIYTTIPQSLSRSTSANPEHHGRTRCQHRDSERYSREYHIYTTIPQSLSRSTSANPEHHGRTRCQQRDAGATRTRRDGLEGLLSRWGKARRRRRREVAYSDFNNPTKCGPTTTRNNMLLRNLLPLLLIPLVVFLKCLALCCFCGSGSRERSEAAFVVIEEKFHAPPTIEEEPIMPPDLPNSPYSRLTTHDNQAVASTGGESPSNSGLCCVDDPTRQKHFQGFNKAFGDYQESLFEDLEGETHTSAVPIPDCVCGNKMSCLVHKTFMDNVESGTLYWTTPKCTCLLQKDGDMRFPYPTSEIPTEMPKDILLDCANGSERFYMPPCPCVSFIHYTYFKKSYEDFLQGILSWYSMPCRCPKFNDLPHNWRALH